MLWWGPMEDSGALRKPHMREGMCQPSAGKQGEQARTQQEILDDHLPPWSRLEPAARIHLRREEVDTTHRRSNTKEELRLIKVPINTL